MGKIRRNLFNLILVLSSNYGLFSCGADGSGNKEVGYYDANFGYEVRVQSEAIDGANIGEITSCTSHYRTICLSNYVYWSNSCGEVEEIVEECLSNYCIDGACRPTSTLDATGRTVDISEVCVPHTNKICLGNSVYLVDSCGNIEELFEECENSSCSKDHCE